MPIKSRSQLRKFYILKKQGKMTQAEIDHWVEATPGKVRDLPERLHKEAFVAGFVKSAAVGKLLDKLKKVPSNTWDKAGLGVLATVPAYHTYKAVKDKKPGEAALGATEVAGLGMLYHAARKAHG